MTNSSSRERDRAVRNYVKDHPGISLADARRAVARRACETTPLPRPLPDVVEPAHGESLKSWIDRVAAQHRIQRHAAMDALGLEPGSSATERLRELAGGMSDHTVARVSAATGLSADRARAMAAVGTEQPGAEGEPEPAVSLREIGPQEDESAAAFARQPGTRGDNVSRGAADRLSALLGMSPSEARAFMSIEAGGPKTMPPKTTATIDLSAGLAQWGNRVLLFDVDSPQRPLPSGFSTVLVDTPWTDSPMPVPQPVWDQALADLGLRDGAEEQRG
ncbi:TniQ family protein [Streptomyces scopuliridis]|uniref:TniQ family protein n=1 Tax=Streptomyces scopuliridis TaxID=452529 RepID=UPI0036CDFEA4